MESYREMRHMSTHASYSYIGIHEYIYKNCWTNLVLVVMDYNLTNTWNYSSNSGLSQVCLDKLYIYNFLKIIIIKHPWGKNYFVILSLLLSNPNHFLKIKVAFVAQVF